MSEYVPTTDDVRFAMAGLRMSGDRFITRESFDRWLADHDAEVRADQIEADIEAVERIKHHHRPSDFGSGWWRSMVDDAVEAIRAQLDGPTS